jgi:micrococcal nuclease
MRRRHPTKGLAALAVGALLLVALIGLLAGKSPTSAPASGRPGNEGVVTYVYDGDTVEVAGVGKVRLLGIDAMDDYNLERTAEQARLYGMSEATVKRWAQEATRFARQTLDHQKVRLEYGPEARDRYGRVLAYVEPGQDRQDFDLLMLTKGLAAAYEVFDHPRLAQYISAEHTAEAQRVGMWKDATILP